MTFKLYNNKSSILKKNARQLQGGDIDVLTNALGYWTKRTDIAKDQLTDIVFKITSRFAGRPDSISFTIYGKNDLTWLIRQYNDFTDIDSVEFVVGREILLPSVDRVFTEILNKPVKFQAVNSNISRSILGSFGITVK